MLLHFGLSAKFDGFLAAIVGLFELRVLHFDALLFLAGHEL